MRSTVVAVGPTDLSRSRAAGCLIGRHLAISRAVELFAKRKPPPPPQPLRRVRSSVTYRSVGTHGKYLIRGLHRNRIKRRQHPQRVGVADRQKEELQAANATQCLHGAWVRVLHSLEYNITRQNLTRYSTCQSADCMRQKSSALVVVVVVARSARSRFESARQRRLWRNVAR